MQIATAVTLFFVAATSLLGGVRNLRMAVATPRPSFHLGTIVAFGMALWCGYLGIWWFSH